jgi:hypothetical protein
MVRVVVFNATFNNIPVGQFYWWMKPENQRALIG